MGQGGGGPSTLNTTGFGNSLSNSNSSFANQSSSQTTYPNYILPYAQQYMQAYNGLALPGGQIAASPYPYNEVAPLTIPQLQGIQAVGAFGQSSPLITGAQYQAAKNLSGQYLNPASNPALNSYYDAAADAMTRQYKFATDPSILAHGAQTGTLVSSGSVQGNQLARYDLGQNLANLAANIYEPAYQQERQIQQGSAQMAPGLVQSQYIPAHEQMQAGGLMQQQAQNVLNTAQGNLQTLGMWPYQLLNLYGGAFGPAAGGGSQTTSQSSGTASGAGGLNSTFGQQQPNPMQTQK